MKLDKITQNRQYPKGFQVVYNGDFYEVLEHKQGISLKLVTHDGEDILLAIRDMDNVYVHNQKRESLRWLYRVEQLGELKKYRVAESKDSGRTWDFVDKPKNVINTPFEAKYDIINDLKAAKELLKTLEKQEEISYASRLNKWEPIT